MSNVPFTSRLGLIENLRKHLLKGKWAVMSGGPMIGKSTLAAHLAEGLSDDQHQAILISLKDADSDAGFWSLTFEALIREGMDWDAKNPYRKNPGSLSEFMSQIHHIAEKTAPQQRSKKIVLLIDGCERFLQQSQNLVPQIVNMAMELTTPAIHSICWIGGLNWDAWAEAHRAAFILPLRFYPLSVVPIREARKIILEHLGPDAVERVWNETGGHPYLMEQAFAKKTELKTDNLVKRMYAELSPEEEGLLEQINPKGDWMILDRLKDGEGHRPAKRLLDRLCMAGMVVRTLDHGTAVVRRASPLFIPKVSG